jgi:hypothetical protein
VNLLVFPPTHQTVVRRARGVKMSKTSETSKRTRQENPFLALAIALRHSKRLARSFAWESKFSNNDNKNNKLN